MSTPPPETPRFVSSNAVDGMAVFARDGDKIGTVAAFMIDRFTGRADYLVIVTGRTLGLGGTFHPLPWSLASFDPRLDGYVIAIDRAMLTSGPSFKSASDMTFDSGYSQRISTYYGVPAA